MRKALMDLEALGIAKDDTNITIFVHIGGEKSSLNRFEVASRLESDLIATLREQAPDAEIDEALPCHLASVAQALRERGHSSVRPDIVEGRLRRETGSLAPKRQGNPGRGKLTGVTDWVQRRITAQPDLTIDELTAELAADHGLEVHRSSVGRLLLRLGLSHKKRPSSA